MEKTEQELCAVLHRLTRPCRLECVEDHEAVAHAAWPGMLNVHDPVNIGIPFVLDMEAEWLDPLELCLPLPSDRHCCQADLD